MPEMFRWDRTPDPAWQDQLDQAFPRAGNGSGLVVRWSPGVPEAPTQRWVVDQMIPQEQCWVTDYREARRVPIPPMGQYLAAVERHRGQSFPHWLDRIRQVLDATGCLAVPLWMIQGTHGGHPVSYETVDRLWAQFTTGATDPPRPGSLPYADFDSRVVAALVARDRWRGKYLSVLAEVDGQEADAEREIRRLMQALVDEQVSEAVDEALPALLTMDLPRVDDPVDYREQVERYLESGEMSGASTGSLAGRPAATRR